jgi:hypothetical protein
MTDTLEQILEAFTTPPRVSQRKLDALSEQGCEAGNALGPKIQRIEKTTSKQRGSLGELFVRLVDGSDALITVQCAPRGRFV